MTLEVFRTDDGSVSVRIVEWDECYHSRRGALQESEHVYVRNGFDAWLQHHPRSRTISVFEMGFGTGLNALLTVRASLRHPSLKVDYRSIEIDPLPEDIRRKLDYATPSEQELFDQLHAAAFGLRTELNMNFSLTKFRSSVLEFVPDETFDVIYFDAFGPRAQPELWTVELLGKVCNWLSPGGFLVTYCAKGVVKRAFREAGFVVEALPGPRGKREMIRVHPPEGNQ